MRTEDNGHFDLAPDFDTIRVELTITGADTDIAPELVPRREIEHLIVTAPASVKDTLLPYLLTATLRRHWQDVIRAAAG